MDSVIPRLVVQVAVSRQAEQARRIKPVRGSSFSSVLQFLSPGFYPVLVPVMTSFNKELPAVK